MQELHVLERAIVDDAHPRPGERPHLLHGSSSNEPGRILMAVRDALRREAAA
jgi:hypothetical protein